MFGMDVIRGPRTVVVDDRPDPVEVDALPRQAAGQRRLHHREGVFEPGEGDHGVGGEKERRRQQRVGAVFLRREN